MYQLDLIERLAFVNLIYKPLYLKAIDGAPLYFVTSILSV
jgi:hypothetical protein